MDQNTIINNSTSSYFKSDQLHHILKIDGSKLCLVCKKRVDCGQNISEFSDPLTNHLNSTLHKREIKSLFELCNPDPVCNSSYEICVDIVNKSVFDMSMLLGEETCYIYKKGKHYFCALCQKNIQQIFKHIEVVKYAIFSHVKGKHHLEKIKEVCWVYPLNKKKEFMLFHKTVVHCSICKNIVQCKENTILQTVVHHLQSDQHNYLTSKNNVIKDENLAIEVDTGFKEEKSSDLTKEKNDRVFKCTIDTENVKSEQFENKYNQNYIVSDVRDNCDQLDWIDSEISVNKGAVDELNSKTLNDDSHPNLYEMIADQLKNCNERKTEAFDFDGQGAEEEDLRDLMRINHTVIQDKTLFCKICNKYLSYRPTANNLAYMTNLTQHFKGKNHKKSKLIYDLTLEKSANNINDKNQINFGKDNQHEIKKTDSEKQELVRHELNRPKKRTDLSLREKERLELLEKVPDITGSKESNINKKFIGIYQGISYCNLCWQEIKYSKNNNVLTNRFAKHIKTEHHKNNEQIRLKKPGCIKWRTSKIKKSLLKKIAQKKLQHNLFNKLERKLKVGKLTPKENRKLLRLRMYLNKI